MHNNIDHAETQKFTRLANRWWNPEGEFHTLHAINPLRMQFIEKQMRLYDKNVLDVGCGGGILSESLARQGAKVVGLDVSEEIIAAARQHANLEKAVVEYRVQTIEDHAQDNLARYHAITCMEMLEHVPNPLSILKASRQLLKPDGHLFLSTLNRNLKSYLKAIVGAEYLLKLLPKGTHEYKKFIKPSELANALRTSGFEIKELAGIDYNPFTKQFKRTENISVNYLVYATCIN